MVRVGTLVLSPILEEKLSVLTIEHNVNFFLSDLYDIEIIYIYSYFFLLFLSQKVIGFC